MGYRMAVRSGQFPDTHTSLTVQVICSFILRVKPKEPLIKTELRLAAQVVMHTSQHYNEVEASISSFAYQTSVVARFS